jgi:hypothetical protein
VFITVVKLTIFNIIFTLTTVTDWEIEHINVKLAFLQSKLDDEVYVEQLIKFAKVVTYAD